MCAAEPKAPVRMANRMNHGSLPRRQRGFTYIALLIAVALIGVALVAASEVWSHSRQREREQELLFIGGQFRQAIERYYQRTPGAVKRYPAKIEDLLEDKRYLATQRYLRKIFVDPMTGKSEWGLIPAPGGGVMGVHSLSSGKPVKTSRFAEEEQAFEGAQRYSEWRFIYQPLVTPALTAPPPQPKAPRNKSGNEGPLTKAGTKAP